MSLVCQRLLVCFSIPISCFLLLASNFKFNFHFHDYFPFPVPFLTVPLYLSIRAQGVSPIGTGPQNVRVQVQVLGSVRTYVLPSSIVLPLSVSLTISLSVTLLLHLSPPLYAFHLPVYFRFCFPSYVCVHFSKMIKVSCHIYSIYLIYATHALFNVHYLLHIATSMRSFVWQRKTI